MPTNAPIYLDHNATTPLLPEVVDAMLPFLRTEFGNPSSSHPWGQRARDAVDGARSQVARLLGCSASEIIFTSGGKEANNLAIRGAAEASPTRRQCVTSVIEHPATANPCRHLEARGWAVHWAKVDDAGRVAIDAVKPHVSDATALVTLMHSNNETGALQPIRELADLARRHGALVHTDAAQSVGKVPVNVEQLGVDLLSLAGHKLNAPKGVGALYLRSGTSIRPFVLGAGHERGLRPGTENVASIVGLGVACDLASTTLSFRTRRLGELRDQLAALLTRAIPGAQVNAARAERLPNTLSIRFPGTKGSDVLLAAPEVAVSTGSACHAGHETASGVLLAMGLGEDVALETVRLSVGSSTTDAEISLAAESLAHAWRRVSERG